MDHLAVIMDGNGRWAEKRHLPRLMGHRAGAEALDRCMHYCKAAGIRYLTVYAFSTENWKRSQEEVSGLMKLLSSYISSKEKTLVKEGVRFRVIGRRSDLSEKLQKEIAALEEKTKAGDFTLIVALSYGGRDEIVRAALRFAEEYGRNPSFIAQHGSLEAAFGSFLDAPDVPDPDLIIRKSGECRTSNFLLWESAYSEYYFTDALWPDFDQAEFDKALESYSKRERRMGGAVEMNPIAKRTVTALTIAAVLICAIIFAPVWVFPWVLGVFGVLALIEYVQLLRIKKPSAAVFALFLIGGAALFAAAFGFAGFTKFPWWLSLAVAFTAAIVGTFGDLVESKFKRWVGVKDSSTMSFTNGMGGILDMFDSLLFAPAAIWMLIALLAA